MTGIVREPSGIERVEARPHFFGYGSLVNRKTHDYAAAHPAKVAGWRRAWRYTALRPVAYLTAIPCAASAIDGLVAEVPGGDWAALDQREHAYDRHRVIDLEHMAPAAVAAEIYAIPAERHVAPDEGHPVLLSYLDVVVQGYLDVFGEAGVTRFFETTDGWDAPILDDRGGRPATRATQRLRPSERDLVDDWLARVEARRITG